MNQPPYKPPPPYVAKQLEQSRRWLETSLREGKNAYFAEDEGYESLDLAGALLSGATMIRANLSHCRLDDAWLNGVLANEVRLNGASLLRSRFVKAQLAGADLSGASGPWANFTKAEADHARFDGGSFPGGRFFQTECIETSFRNAQLDEASFTRAFLKRADFMGALLDGADFTDASVEDVNFTGAFFMASTRLQGSRHLDSAIADRIFFNGRAVEGDAAREVLKSLTNPNVYDLLQPRERQLRLMLDCVKAARWSDKTIKQTSGSLLSLCSALEGADQNWREDVASHAATLGSASLAAPDVAFIELDEGRARIAWATLDTLEALIRAPRFR